MTLSIYYTKSERTAQVAKAEALIKALYPENSVEFNKKQHTRLMRMSGDTMATTIYLLEKELSKAVEKLPTFTAEILAKTGIKPVSYGSINLATGESSIIQL